MNFRVAMFGCFLLHLSFSGQSFAQEIGVLPDSLKVQEVFYVEGDQSSVRDRLALKLEEEREFWTQIESIVFLGEGGDSNWEGTEGHLPFASAIHRAFPQIRIIKTDLDKKEKHSEDGKVSELAVNHTRHFSDSILAMGGKVDALVMLRGLCQCGIINGNTSFYLWWTGYPKCLGA